MQTVRKVAVIGAGPAGLVTAKYLLDSHRALGTEPLEVKVFESEDAIGGTFYARMYEDGELVSSKQLTAFSDFRLSDDEPDFLPVTRYLQYLNEYCDHFKIRPHIFLNTKVDSITRKSTLKGDKHLIEYTNTQTGDTGEFEADAVAVCCGLHVTPNIPHIPGMEKVPVRLHSSQFKTREQFGVDKTVMILGVGETGSDMAYLAVTSPTKQVVLCHRFGFHFAPKRNVNPAILPILGGKAGGPTIPLDNARASLFDTSYVHPLLRDSPALWSFYNKYVRFILWFSTGTPGGYDQLVGEPDSELDHVSRMFFVKSNRAAAYVSKPFRGVLDTSLVQRVRRALINVEIPDTHGRQIDLAPWPERIDPDGTVVFRKNGRPEYDRVRTMGIRPDVLLFATGYRQEFPIFDKQAATGTNPYSLPGEANVRNIWHRDDPTVGFVGFLRPNLGAIPPLAEMQAQLWILNLLAPNRIPKPLHPRDEPHYRLWNPLRIHYGVDHESYVYQLACDMGSAQGFLNVLGRGLTFTNGNWKLPLVWAFSSNLNLRFRVRGPWHWEGAEGAMKGEMWAQMKKRRWISPVSDVFWLSVLPISIFGPLSFLCWVYATVYWLIFGVEPGYGGYDCYGNKIAEENKSSMGNASAYGLHRQGRIM